MNSVSDSLEHKDRCLTSGVLTVTDSGNVALVLGKDVLNGSSRMWSVPKGKREIEDEVDSLVTGLREFGEETKSCIIPRNCVRDEKKRFSCYAVDLPKTQVRIYVVRISDDAMERMVSNFRDDEEVIECRSFNVFNHTASIESMYNARMFNNSLRFIMLIMMNICARGLFEEFVGMLVEMDVRPTNCEDYMTWRKGNCYKIGAEELRSSGGVCYIRTEGNPLVNMSLGNPVK